MTPQPNVPGLTGLMVQPVSDVAPNNVPGLTGLMVQPVSDAPLGNGYNNYNDNDDDDDDFGNDDFGSVLHADRVMVYNYPTPLNENFNEYNDVDYNDDDVVGGVLEAGSLVKPPFSS